MRKNTKKYAPYIKHVIVLGPRVRCMGLQSYHLSRILVFELTVYCPVPPKYLICVPCKLPLSQDIFSFLTHGMNARNNP